MIILDTHIRIWWVMGDSKLTSQHHSWLQEYRSSGLGVSIISCWEVAKLVEKKKLLLPCSIDQWLDTALAYPGIHLLQLTLSIIIQATQLNGFHRDPSDQIIVATALIHQCSLLTVDEKILTYPLVQTLK